MLANTKFVHYRTKVTKLYQTYFVQVLQINGGDEVQIHDIRNCRSVLDYSLNIVKNVYTSN
jgi:hypothetical protein